MTSVPTSCPFCDRFHGCAAWCPGPERGACDTRSAPVAAYATTPLSPAEATERKRWVRESAAAHRLRQERVRLLDAEASREAYEERVERRLRKIRAFVEEFERRYAARPKE